MMTKTVVTYPESQIELSGISWNTYQSLLQDLSSSRRLKLTYYRGNLEIVTPDPEHEIYKETLGRFVETLAEELEINIYPLGSTTLKRLQQSGAEPDKCFYIKNRQFVQGKKRIDLEKVPPPDLIVEIDITSSSATRMIIYAEMGVPELWCYDGKVFRIYIRESEQYAITENSLVFPNISLQEIEGFLKQIETTEYLDLIREFRAWVKTQISKQ
jgi:Uma2 family endonuclease